MANFFKDKLKINIPIRDTVRSLASGKSILQKEADKRNLKSEPMRFDVGAGLTPQQKVTAQETLRKPSGVKKNFFAELIEPLPRLAGSFAAEVTGQPIQFGRGEPTLPISRKFQESEEKYGKTLGPLAVGATSILDATDAITGGGKSKVGKELTEKLIKELGEKEARVILSKGSKTLAEKALKESIQVNERNIIKELSRNIPKLHESVGRGVGTIDDWAEAVNILEKVDKGAETAQDLARAKNILKTNKTKELEALGFKMRQLEMNPEAGFIKVPSKQEIKDTGQTIRTQLYDRLAPLEDLTKGKVPFDKDPYPAARLYAGVFGKAQNKLDELGGILKTNEPQLEKIKKYAKLEREIEKAGQGVTKFEGGRTIDQIRSEKDLFDQDPAIEFIKEGTEQIRAYSNKMLDELKDAGVLSPEMVANIRIKNQKYIPFDRLEYVAEQMENIPRGQKSFNVTKQDVVKQMSGSEKEIADPIESLVRKTYAVTSLAERNKVALKVADLAELPSFKGVVQKIKGEVPAGMEKLSVFRNGVKEEYAVPKTVGEALKGLTTSQADIVTKVMNRFSTAPLRAGATGFNLAFLPANMIRDIQSAVFTSKVGFNPADWIRGLGEAILKGDDYKKFRESGGSFSGFFEGQKAVPDTIKKLMESNLSKTVKTIINPFELIRKAGEIVELAPRLGVFKKSLRKGKSLAEAGFNAREATVDFSKTGSAMKIINQWVPFLNANIQGKANVFKAFRDNPRKSALLATTLIAAPATATYFHNSRNFPDVWNDISQYEKDNNFIIIYGDDKDEDGKYTQVVKIPKADVAKVFGNITENMLAYGDKNNSKSVQDLGVQILSDMSPVGFEREGDVSLNQTLSGVTPPLLKAGIETATNKNLYTGYDIVPKSMEDASPREQYKETTSPVAKFIGKNLNISPLKVENAAGTLFGGVGRQVLDPSQLGEQVSGRFDAAKGGEIDRRSQEEAAEFLTEQADEKLRLKREAKRTLQKIQESDDPASDFKTLKESDPTLAEKVKELKEEQDLGFTSLDYDIKALNVANGQRAKFIISQFNRLKTKQEKADLWEDLAKKKLLTKDVQKQVKYLLNNSN